MILTIVRDPLLPAGVEVVPPVLQTLERGTFARRIDELQRVVDALDIAVHRLSGAQRAKPRIKVFEPVDVGIHVAGKNQSVRAQASRTHMVRLRTVAFPVPTNAPDVVAAAKISGPSFGLLF